MAEQEQEPCTSGSLGASVRVMNLRTRSSGFSSVRSKAMMATVGNAVRRGAWRAGALLRSVLDSRTLSEVCFLKEREQRLEVVRCVSADENGLTFLQWRCDNTKL